MTRTIFAGRVLFGDGVLRSGEVVVEDDHLAEVREASNVPGQIIAPGLIDLQVNGAFGSDFTANPATIRVIAPQLPRTGVTAFLPTIVTSPLETYRRAFDVMRALPDDLAGARVLGLHLEGPYISAQRAGAHNPAFIRKRVNPQGDGLIDESVRVITLAPELISSVPAIGALRAHGIVVSLGHTAATFEQAQDALDSGAMGGTHLFNAMTPLHHREPGVVGALLADERATVGVIPDGVHVHPSIFGWLIKAKGAGRVALVTDQMAAAGLGEGEYQLGDRRVTVDETSARLENGTLAGSILTLDQGVRNLVAWGACSLAEALTMASTTPARLLGLDHLGRIEAGGGADLVVLDEDLRVKQTIVGGQVVYSS